MQSMVGAVYEMQSILNSDFQAVSNPGLVHLWIVAEHCFRHGWSTFFIRLMRSTKLIDLQNAIDEGAQKARESARHCSSHEGGVPKKIVDVFHKLHGSGTAVYEGHG
jgi:hypothetical protein